jgi:hypothetical protein
MLQEFVHSPARHDGPRPRHANLKRRAVYYEQSFGQILPMEEWRMANKKQSYDIEKRPVQGDYAVRKPGSERASAVQPTQGKAIDRAKELNPDAGLRVERVRNTKAGSPDKWRKA